MTEAVAPAPSRSRRRVPRRRLVGLACAVWTAGAVAQSSSSSPSAPAVDASSYNLHYDSIQHPVIARKGMVVSQSDIASRIGADVLRDGGNAVDAAVAVGFALAVTLPRAGNLGGSGFMLIHLARENRTVALEYYSQAPAGIRAHMLLDANGAVDESKRYSHLGAGVPGTVAGLYHAHQRYGKRAWKRLLQPAIELAARGVMVTDDFAHALNARKDRLARNSAAASTFFKRDLRSYAPTEKLVQSDLAWSLRQIARHGADAFYKGAIAGKIVADMQAQGGVMTREDLAAYAVKEQEPLWEDYRGHRIALMPPPASGALLAQLLNVIEQFPLSELGPNSVDSIHLMAEATKLVLIDRSAYFGGYPDYRVPARGFTSDAYAQSLAAQISSARSRAPSALRPGDPYAYESRDTTHYSIMDSNGNVVSNTYTLGASFGAHVVVAGAGFLLNDHIGNFALRAGAAGGGEMETSIANALAPGKRAISTITPVIVFRNDRPYIVSGSPDGVRIITSVAQLLVNVIDHGLNIAEATARPRVFQSLIPGELELEPGHPVDIARLLEQRGHRVRFVRNMGSTQSVLYENGLYFGAADTRRPDAAAAGVD
ncbi:MAG: gamma-glutamyltransferase [Steroidobacter sp.]